MKSNTNKIQQELIMLRNAESNKFGGNLDDFGKLVSKEALVLFEIENKTSDKSNNINYKL